MQKQTKSQQKNVSRVMHEFKQGELKSSSGDKVKSRKQAIAIGLSEAGASKHQNKAQKQRAKSRRKSS